MFSFRLINYLRRSKFWCVITDLVCVSQYELLSKINVIGMILFVLVKLLGRLDGDIKGPDWVVFDLF